MEVVYTARVLVRPFEIDDEGDLEIGPVVHGAWRKPVQPCACRLREVEGHVSEGVVDVASRHVHHRKIITEPIVRLRVSRVFIDAAYDERFWEGMGYHRTSEAWKGDVRSQSC